MKYLQRSYIWARRIYYFITGFGMAFILSGALVIGQSQPIIAATTPSINLFQDITFRTVSPDFQLGYSTEFQTEQLTLSDTCTRLGQPLSQCSLQSNIGFLNKGITVGDLSKIISEFLDTEVIKSPLLKDLFEPYIGDPDEQTKVGEVLNEIPELANLKIVDPDNSEVDLSNYSCASGIANLCSTKIGAFPNFETVPCRETTVCDLSWSVLPNPPSIPSNLIVAKADLFLSAVEGANDGKVDFDESRVLTGSDQSGYRAPCADLCAQIEMVHPGGSQVTSELNGKVWISGDTQKVKGGYGPSALENSGWEPTGLYPFGPHFKVVLTNVDEATDTAKLKLFWHRCHAFTGCTPYYMSWPGGDLILQLLGLGDIKTGSLLPVGIVPAATGTPVSTPTSAAHRWWAAYQAGTIMLSSSQGSTSSSSPGSNNLSVSTSTSENNNTNDDNDTADTGAANTGWDLDTSEQTNSSLNNSSVNDGGSSTATPVSPEVVDSTTTLIRQQRSQLFGPVVCSAPDTCSTLMGPYSIPSDQLDAQHASARLASELIKSNARTVSQTPSSQTTITVSNSLHAQDIWINGINLREKFYEEFPDGGKQLAAEWLQKVATEIPNPDGKQLTAQQLLTAVLGGTHLPNELSDAVMRAHHLNRTAQRAFQSQV